jgi:hypothetical protein
MFCQQCHSLDIERAPVNRKRRRPVSRRGRGRNAKGNQEETRSFPHRHLIATQIRWKITSRVDSSLLCLVYWQIRKVDIDY